MERRLVAPCTACGADPRERTDFERGRHTYEEWLLFPEVKAHGVVVLCNYCEADIPSWDPTVFGLPSHAEVGARMVRRRARPDVRLEEDWVCPRCNHRGAMLDLMARARRAYATPVPARKHRDMPQN